VDGHEQAAPETAVPVGTTAPDAAPDPEPPIPDWMAED
jgi:hypothetical protein